MKITKGISWPFLILSIASTLLFMAGLASLQHTCYNVGSWPGIGGGNSSPTAAFGMSDGFGSCRKVLRFYWFTFAFVIATLLGLAVTTAMKNSLHFSRPFWTGMVTISIVLMMIASEAFLGFTDLYEGPAGNNAFGPWINRMRVAAAGAIISVAFLIFLLMGLGVDWENRTGGAAYHGKHQPVGVPATNVRVVDQV